MYKIMKQIQLFQHVVIRFQLHYSVQQVSQTVHKMMLNYSIISVVSPLMKHLMQTQNQWVTCRFDTNWDTVPWKCSRHLRTLWTLLRPLCRVNKFEFKCTFTSTQTFEMDVWHYFVGSSIILHFLWKKNI